MSELIGRGWAFPPQIGTQGGISLTRPQNEIEQAMLIILGTAPGERVMRPTFGCRLHELLFAPNNARTAAQARRYVSEALGMWEPRIRLDEVSVYPDAENGHVLVIEVTYTIKNTLDRRTLVHPFYLIPEE